MAEAQAGRVKPRILVIAGPTASGKTAAALIAARALDAEIISADARQVYKGLDIGTAKPTDEERASVPHHFLDHADITQTYTAGAFYREASARVMEILGRGKRVVVCGGSGLYVKVLVDGIFDGPDIPPETRRILLEDLHRLGPDLLFQELEQRDIEASRWVPRTNLPRLLRALEVCRATGVPYSSLREERMPDVPYDSVLTGLRWDRLLLYERIDRRVEAMLAAGFLDEVRRLLDAGADPDCAALNTVGYRDALAYLRGACSGERMIALMKQHTRNYAKRQLTWFRKEDRMRWFDAASDEDVAKAAEAMTGHFLALADER